jgi:hypothetical protein
VVAEIYHFHILRSSSIWGHLPSEVIFHLRSSSIGNGFPSEVVFHWRSSSSRVCLRSEVVFHQMSSSLGGSVPSEVVFHQRLSSIGGRLPSKVIWLLRYSLFCNFKKNLAAGGWVGVWFVQIIMPLCGPSFSCELVELRFSDGAIIPHFATYQESCKVLF